MNGVRPTAPEVRQQLARILGSGDSGNAPQLRPSLQYRARARPFVRRRMVAPATVATLVPLVALAALLTGDAPGGPRSPSLLMLPLSAAAGDRVLAEGFTARSLDLGGLVRQDA